MRGTDCTDAQIEHASKFLADRGWPDAVDDPVAPVSFHRVPRREDIVRLIAWYGALRFKAARDGVGGTLEEPGELITSTEVEVDT